LVLGDYGEVGSFRKGERRKPIKEEEREN